MLSEGVKKKIAKMGIEPDDLMQRLRGHIGSGKTFASPEGYAAEIQRKQAAGQPLSDQQTAREFQQIAPALFGRETPQTAFPFSVGQVPEQLQQTLEPDAHAMLSALAQYQRETPFTIPYAPGTPTQEQVRFDEGVRQWEWEKDMAERQFAYKQQQDAIANQLARARLAAGTIEPTEDYTGYDNKNYTKAVEIAKENYEREGLVWEHIYDKEQLPYREGRNPGPEYVLKKKPGTKRFEDLDRDKQKKLIDEAYFMYFDLPNYYKPDTPSSLYKPGSVDAARDVAQKALDMGYSKEDVAALLVTNYGVRPENIGDIAPGLAGMYRRPPRHEADLRKDFRGLLGS